jgi:hypothetical protein
MFSINLRIIAASFAFTGGVSLRAAIAIEGAVGSARVDQIVRTSEADLVILDAGQESGLRQGMVCVVIRDGAKLGEILLVDLRLRSASALILDLQPGQALQSGDPVAVKTVSSKNQTR